jgi:hypothetical protein
MADAPHTELRTLDTGWVRMKQADGTVVPIYDPPVARLLRSIYELDRQTIADCTEADPGRANLLARAIEHDTHRRNA